MKSRAKYLQEWRKRNPGKAAEYNRKYRERHPHRVEKQRKKERDAYVKKGRIKLNPEEKRRRRNEQARRWRENNRDKVNDANRRSYRNNTETHRMCSRNYKARVRAGREGIVRSSDLKRILAEQKWRCAICGEMLGSDKELDHKIPISKGGKHMVENVQWTCRRCNRKKGNKLLLCFIQI
jgi:5-methylcytosine-specific restriction endonuclease McrA